MRAIELAGRAYNHCLDLHYRFWGLYHRTIHVYALQKHLTKLRHIPRFAWLKDINSQALQDIAQRIDRSYRLFWQHKENGFYGAPPKKQDVRKYTSFTLKQSGWKLDEATHTIRLLGQNYRYFKSRPIEGKIQTVNVKREENGDIFVSFVCRIES